MSVLAAKGPVAETAWLVNLRAFFSGFEPQIHRAADVWPG